MGKAAVVAQEQASVIDGRGTRCGDLLHLVVLRGVHHACEVAGPACRTLAVDTLAAAVLSGTAIDPRVGLGGPPGVLGSGRATPAYNWPTVKRLLGFISPWALAGIAVWLAVLGLVANWAIPVFANVSSGPACQGPPCPPSYLPIDWFPVLGTAIIGASIVTALVAGVVVLVRRRDPQ